MIYPPVIATMKMEGQRIRGVFMRCDEQEELDDVLMVTRTWQKKILERSIREQLGEEFNTTKE